MQTFSGREYLKIAIANHYGLDKKSWQERIAWTDDNYNNLIQIAMSGEADEPAEMLGAIQALHNTENGIPTGFPVGLDATCSCLQLMACVTNDKQAMKCCNVLGTSKREDAYKIVYDDMCEQLGQTGSLKRVQIKEAIMTGIYGSLAKPKEIFGDRTPEFYQFRDSMNALFPRVWRLREMMLNRWNSQAEEYNWVMPDNFHVHIDVMRSETLKANWDGHTEYFQRYVKGCVPKGRSLGANLIHSIDAYILREIIRRTNYAPNRLKTLKNIKRGEYYEDENTRMILILLQLYKESGVLSQRILDYVKPYNRDLISDSLFEKLLARMAPKPFQLIGIHDCFRVHANYCNELRKQYIELLAELAESDILDYLCMQINHFRPGFMRIHGLGDMIRKTSEYALS